MAQAVKVGNVQISSKNLSKSTAAKLGVSNSSSPSPAGAITNNKTSATGVAPGQAGWVDPTRSARDTATRNANNIRPATADDTTVPTGVDTKQPQDASSGAQAGQLSYQDALKSLNSGGLTGTALTDAQKSLAGAYGQAPSTPFTQAHQQLQQSGAAPSDGGAAMAAVQNAKPYQPDQTAVDQVFSQDPVINNLMSSAWDLLSPANTKTSLMDDYKKLYKESGLKDINAEMIDAETIINGTEQDIRNEIQTAGGFGTDSQVQSMALARNKNLLKRYNALAEMQTNATNQLNTMLNLDSQDRQMAQQRVSAQVSALFNFAQFRQQATNNIKEGFNNLVDRVGYSGAYAAYASHPDQLAAIESTMGLAPGGLAQLASQPDYNMLLKQAQLEASRASTAASYSSIAKNNYEMQATQLANQSAQNETVGTADTVIGATNTAISQLTSGLKVGGMEIPFTQGLGKTGITGNISALIGKGPGKDLASTLDTVKSNIAFDELQKMRKASPTGGAVGNVSDTDMKLLAAKKASLDIGQDPAQLLKNIQIVQNDYINMIKKMGYQYDAQTGTIITP